MGASTGNLWQASGERHLPFSHAGFETPGGGNRPQAPGMSTMAAVCRGPLMSGLDLRGVQGQIN